VFKDPFRCFGRLADLLSPVPSAGSSLPSRLSSCLAQQRPSATLDQHQAAAAGIRMDVLSQLGQLLGLTKNVLQVTCGGGCSSSTFDAAAPAAAMPSRCETAQHQPPGCLGTADTPAASQARRLQQHPAAAAGAPAPAAMVGWQGSLQQPPERAGGCSRMLQPS